MTPHTTITPGSPELRAIFGRDDATGMPKFDVPKARCARPACFHCGTACRTHDFQRGGKAFCCQGCLIVFELLTENGLDGFYRLNDAAGVRIRALPGQEQFQFVDEPGVRGRLVDFTDDRVTRVTFHVPAIHCIACVWLLENLFKLKPGIGESQVNFPRKEVAITFSTAQVRLSEVVSLLASLGYEPELSLADLDRGAVPRASRRLWLQLAVAGFAFGNNMFFAIAGYLGLDSFSGPAFQRLVGFISLGLAIPVVVYSAADYWRSAWVSLRQRLLNIDVPIVAGIAALFAQSCWEVFSGRGVGYFDSLAGLLFFLLCGKVFQQKTYDRLAFDRDYKSFFPLSVTRRRGGVMESRSGGVTESRSAPTVQHSNTPTFQHSVSDERVSLSQLVVGDRLIIRNGELIPADGRLLDGPALIDYSFVTGESEPVAKRAGDYLYAGGRQMGGAIEVETVKAASQSYLTSLWNQEAFRKAPAEALDNLTNRYSQRFTKWVMAIALAAAGFWAFVNPALSLKSGISVLIVACPCALALAAPFALGAAQRLLARRQVFLRNPHVLEALARVNSVVFDKTGTLTAAGAGAVAFQGADLSEAEERMLYSMTRHSTHPFAVRIGEALGRDHFPEQVRSFLETPGCGMEGSVAGNEIWMGSAAWLESRGASCRRRGDEFQTPTAEKLEHIHEPALGAPASRWRVLGMGLSQHAGETPALPGVAAPWGSPHVGSYVHVAINGKYRGGFNLISALRPETDQLITDLAGQYDLALVSGDNAKERERFGGLFGAGSQLLFSQSPLEKLGFIRRMQASGRTVMMVGDGLNDAGALKQSDVGVAVVENISAFSPTSDVIVAAGMVPRLEAVLRFARASVRVVRASFVISAVYNVVGIAIAASGLLSPVVCAILMPLSSVTVVAFACGVTSWLGRRILGGAPISDLARSSRLRAGSETGAPKLQEASA